MFAFFTWLTTAVTNAILSVFASQLVMKAIVAAAIYAFVFSILPLMIGFLVPYDVLNALKLYVQVLTQTTIGQGVLYIADFFQFWTLCAIMLPTFAVRFLFRRI